MARRTTRPSRRTNRRSRAKSTARAIGGGWLRVATAGLLARPAPLLSLPRVTVALLARSYTIKIRAGHIPANAGISGNFICRVDKDSCDEQCNNCHSSCDHKYGFCENSSCDHKYGFSPCYWYASWKCDTRCDGDCYSPWTCDQECDQQICDGCNSYCDTGCSSCPSGKYSAASTSLVAPRAVAESRHPAHA